MAIPKGDAEKGKKIFMQRCAHCHSIDADGRQSSLQAHAPNLYGIVGRRAGTVPGYNSYTEALKNNSRQPVNLLADRRAYSVASVASLYGMYCG